MKLVVPLLTDKAGLVCLQTNMVCNVVKQSDDSKSHPPGQVVGTHTAIAPEQALVSLPALRLSRHCTYAEPDLVFDEVLYPQPACT